jgi:hypothetical protein
MGTLAAADVELSFHEMLICTHIGGVRRMSALKNGRPGRRTTHHLDAPWDIDIEAAMAEAAVAKHLNVWWSGQLGNLKAADASALQVRWTHWPNGFLRIIADDANDQNFVLVVGSQGHYRIVGYIRGADGKREEWWRPDHDCWGVPQSAVLPLPQSWFRNEVGSA